MRFTLCFDGATAGEAAGKAAQQTRDERVDALREALDAVAQIFGAQRSA